MQHPQILSIFIAGSGFFGGWANYLMEKLIENRPSWHHHFLKSIILGIAAAALVPLFLATISSNILETAGPPTFPQKNYFLFTGFCLLAAIISQKFIEDLYARVMKAEKAAMEAKQTAKTALATAHDLADAVTEPEVEPAITPYLQSIQPEAGQSDLQSEILTTIIDSKYVYRTLTGIATGVNQNLSVVAPVLEEMERAGILESKMNKKGNKIWKHKTLN